MKTLLEQGFGKPQEQKVTILKDPAMIREAFKAYCENFHLFEKPYEQMSDEELMALIIAEDEAAPPGTAAASSGQRASAEYGY